MTYDTKSRVTVIATISQSLKLFHLSSFVDFENTFDTTEEPDYLLVHLESDADVEVSV